MRLLSSLLLAVVLACLASTIAAAIPGDGDGAPRLRELYVPYDQFVTIAGENPDGLVIDLTEYRELVRRAAAVPVDEPLELPPVAAAITHAHTRIGVEGTHAICSQRLTVRVTHDGWVRCPLGSALPSIGSIQVGDAPGWVVRDGDRADLLLRGRGTHTVRVTFTAPIGESEAGSALDTNVVAAAAGTFRLEVPGRARAQAVIPSTDVAPISLAVLPEATTGDRTVFVGSLGARNHLRLEWERERSRDANPLLTTSAQRLSILARREDPRFAATATIAIARRSVDTLRFRVPAHFTVVAVTSPSGATIHHWERVDDSVVVTLGSSLRGRLTVRFDGSIGRSAAAGDTPGTLIFSPIRLEGAHSDFGEVFVFTRPYDTVAFSDLLGLDILDPSESGITETFPNRVGDPALPWGEPVARFGFTRSTARATATITEEPTVVALRQTALVHEDLERRRLHLALEWRVESGRAREVGLALPPGWRIIDLRPIGAEVPLRVDESLVDGRPVLRILPVEALDRDRPLDLHLVLEPEVAPVAAVTPFVQGGEEGAAPPRAVSFPLPSPLDARLVRSDLGLVLTDTMLLTDSTFDAWRALGAHEIPALLESPAGVGLTGLGARLVVAVTTESAEATVAYRARRLPAQGDVRSVTHLIAAERGTADGDHSVRVRTDLQVVVLDHAIDRVTIEHPRFPGNPAVHVLGDGIREVVPTADGTGQVVRFIRPWIGARLLRFETEFAATPGSEIAFPEIGLGDRFGGPRFLVVQSQGSVEISIAPGAGLARVPLDDIPDFAEPWRGGRVLQAFRHRRAPADSPTRAGTFMTTVHSRAPVLTQLIGRLDLETALGGDRSSRTLATLLLSSAREQVLRVDIPEDALCLAVTIDGEPIANVRSDRGAGVVPDGFRRIAIPLPPRSHARLTILTERVRPGGLGSIGTHDHWRETGIRLVDGPVGETHWRVVVPPAWRARAGRGGNLVPDDGELAGRESFARSFFGALFTGQWPRFRAFASLPPERGPIEIPHPLSAAESAGALRGETDPVGGLSPRGKDDPFAIAGGAIDPPFLPNGRVLALSKFGGNPELDLVLSDPERMRARARFVFAATLLLCFLLARARLRRELWGLIVGGLFLGTFLPPAIGWSSPMLAIPFCEGLVVSLLALGLARLGKPLSARLRRRGDGQDPILDATPASLLLAALLVTIGNPAAAQEGRITPAPAEELAPLPSPFDTVLIPYPSDDPPWGDSAPEPKVYLSHERFRELWRLVHPEETPVVELAPPGVSLAIGPARHALRIDGDHYRLRAEVTVHAFPPAASVVRGAPASETWNILRLPPHTARLERVTIDGVEAAFTTQRGSAEIALRGTGSRRVVVEWVGRVARDRGISSLDAPLFPAFVNRLEGALPAGAELDRTHSHPRIVLDSSGERGATEDGAIPFTAELGSAPGISLRWSFARIEGDLTTQLSSSSYSALRLLPDLVAVTRFEGVRATGRPVERVRYRVRGGLEITEVTGERIAEWNLLPAEAGGTEPTLEVLFGPAVEQASFRIDAIAAIPSGDTDLPLPTLTLEGAVRQETFIGVQHGVRQRFAADSFANLTRASAAEVRALFSLDLSAIDRIHHAHGDARDARFSVVLPPRRVRAETDAIARVTPRGVETFLRTRFVEAREAPLSLTIPLPARWELARVDGEIVRDHAVTTTAEGARLTVRFLRTPRPGDEISWSARVPSVAGAAIPDSLTLPFIAIGPAVDDESLTWTVVGESALDLTTPPTAGWEMIPPDRVPLWVAIPGSESARFTLRANRTRVSGSITVAVRPRAGLLRGTVVSFAHLGEEWLTVHSRIVADIRTLGRDTLALDLPPNAELVGLDLRDERERVVAPRGDGSGRTRVTVRLLSAVTGPVTLDLLHRIARPASGEDAPPIAIEPVRILGDSGAPLAEAETWVGLVQPGSDLDLSSTAEGLTAIERERMPFLPDGIRASAIRSTWTATRPDWRLTLREQVVTVAEGLAAVVPLLDLATRIGPDGTIRTEAIFTLRNERLQFLGVELPKGATLWGVTVDGNPVSVATEGTAAVEDAPSSARRIRIPVDPAVGAQLAREIVLTYEESAVDLPSWTTRTDLVGPTVLDRDVRVVETIWTVRFPEGYRVEETSGSMRQTPPSARFAEKLDQLVAQQQEIIEATRSLDSQRERRRAAQQLARIEQQLGDSVVGLQQLDGSSGEESQRLLLGDEPLERQRRENAAVLERSAGARAEIRAALQAEASREAIASPEDRAFQDRVQFLHGRWWRDGNLAAPRESTAPTHAGAPTPEELLESASYRTWSGVIPLVPGGSIEVAQPKAIDTRGGLPPLPDAARLRAASSLPPATPDDGRTTYTFRGASDARLTLAFRRDGAGLKWWSWGMLIVAAGAVFLWARREG